MMRDQMAWGGSLGGDGELVRAHTSVPTPGSPSFSEIEILPRKIKLVMMFLSHHMRCKALRSFC